MLSLLTALVIACTPVDPPASRPAAPPVSAPAAPTEKPATTRVSFRLVDGVRVRGTLTSWTIEGIDGSFGPRGWSELRCDDAWDLLRRIHDHKDPVAWLDIGRVMLTLGLDQPEARERAERHAEYAFRAARRLDPAVEEAITEIRGDIDAERDLRAAEQQAEEAARLRTLSPEAGPWTNDPWPQLSPEDQETAVIAMKADARRILESAGLSITPVETRFFLFYSDMAPREAQRWVKQLDTMYELLARRFGLEPDVNIFWGKAVIFVFGERDRFRLVEAEAFNHLVPEWADGLFHPMGPKSFVSFYRQPRDEIFAAVLVHETTHAFMHRYKTPRRLPTWANEGIADYMASVLFRGSVVDLDRRRKGLRWIRNNGDVDAALDWSYTNGGWPGEKEIGYSVGYLLVELMIRDQPRSFGAWVDAIKDGADWEEALADTFNTDRSGLVETFVRFYRVND